MLSHFALFLVTIVAQAQPEAVGIVEAEMVEMLAEPDAAAYSLGWLRAGERVRVVGEGPEGWLAIEPPDGSVCWIPEGAIQEQGDGLALVVSERTTVRSGRAEARMPGPPHHELTAGAVVRLQDRPPLELRQGRRFSVWRAIDPPDGSVVYVRAGGVRVITGEAGPRRRPVSSSGGGPVRRVTIDPELTWLGPEARPGSLAPELEAPFRRVEVDHRHALRQPIDEWRLEAILSRYQSLQELARDGASREILDGRVAQVRRQIEAGKAARRFSDLLRKASVLTGSELDDPDRPRREEEFANVGLLEPSLRLIDGARCYALIGDDGKVAAYLKVPPGLAVEKLIGRRVGVSGRARYDEQAYSTVIDVQEIEALGGAP